MEISNSLQLEEPKGQRSTTVHTVTVEAHFWPCGVHVQTFKKDPGVKINIWEKTEKGI